MKTAPETKAAYEPSIGEVAAAGMLGFIAVVVAVALIHAEWSVRATGVVLAVATLASAMFAWIGRGGLKYPRTWIVAGKMAGSILITLGSITLITGYHTEGPEKIWRRVDRDSDLHLLVIGLFLWGLALLLEALRKKPMREDGRTRRYRQPR